MFLDSPFFASMPNCVVPTCCCRTSAKSKRQEEMEKHTKITFHRFPRAEDRRLQWARAVGLDPTTLSKIAYICSLHFAEESFDRTSLACVRLRNHAVPYMNKADVHKSKEDYSSPNVKQTAKHSLSEKIHSTATDHDIFSEKIIQTPKLCIKTEEVCEVKLPERQRQATIFEEINVQPRPLTSDAFTQTPVCRDAGVKSIPIDVREAGSSTEQMWENPTATLLRKAMQHQKETSGKLIRTLKQRNRRQMKKIAERFLNLYGILDDSHMVKIR